MPGISTISKFGEIDGQGQPRVINYINFVDLECLMVHAKFQDQGTSGSVVICIYVHGSHLLTKTILINLSSFPRRFAIKNDLEWPSSFRDL